MQDFHFQPFEPDPPLDLVLTQTFYARGRIPYRSDKILPTGLIPVLFNLGNPHRLGKAADPESNPSFAHGWVDGFQTTPTYHTPTDGTHVIGLLFEPVGFHALFDVDMATLRDRTVDAREIMPAAFVTAIENHYEQAGDDVTHRTFHELVRGWPRQSLPDWLWALYREIRDRRGDVVLKDRYTSIDRSPRQITARFKRAIGVTPKKLCRIHRLLALLEAVDPAGPVNWTELAHSFDFHDQAHFNHEFRALSGLYPSEYLSQRRGEYPDLEQGEHVVFAPQN
ncbi:MAG: helix-turn-helix domain-containing protein [Acidobacteriota bacterium]